MKNTAKRKALPVVRCSIHGTPMQVQCPACLGSRTSKAKAVAARRNGLLGGRPRKKKAK